MAPKKKRRKKPLTLWRALRRVSKVYLNLTVIFVNLGLEPDRTVPVFRLRKTGSGLGFGKMTGSFISGPSRHQLPKPFLFKQTNRHRQRPKTSLRWLYQDVRQVIITLFWLMSWQLSSPCPCEISDLAHTHSRSICPEFQQRPETGVKSIGIGTKMHISTVL